MATVDIEEDVWTPPEIPLPCEKELLDEARLICRERLSADPNLTRELNLLGLLVGRAGARELAVGCLTRAAALAPANATYVADLAAALPRGGRAAEAVDASLKALSLEPGRTETLLLLAQSLHRNKRLVEAAAIYDEYLRQQPGDAIAVAELADVRRDQGRSVEAIAGYEASQRIDRTFRARAGMQARIAQVHLANKDWAAALEACDTGLSMDEGRADLHRAMGQALMGQGKLEEAVSAYRDTLNIEPMDNESTRQLVFALELLGRRADASRAWLHLGITFEVRDAFAEAAAAFRQALARKSDCLDALLRLGWSELQQERPAEAIEPLRAGLAIEPTHITGHFHLGCALQLTGDWDGGWDEFGWLSHQRRINAWRAFEQPRWDGSSLEGKRILFFAGQDYGLGDTIHLVRFARHLKRRGAFVIVECQPRLASLLERMPDIDFVAPRGAPLRAFDTMAPMMWVPSVDRSARTLLASDVPYLSGEPELVERWRGRLQPTTAKRIGICWGGQSDRRDAHRRFASLTAFSPLASVANVHFVSLQMGPQSDEVFCPPPGMQVEVLQHDGHSLDDTAALIESLDLVITVDTMVGHLAGAMGRPVWTVLPFAAEWRWLKGETTAWYPSMRLFRQTKQGDWTVVMEQVRAALEEWAS